MTEANKLETKGLLDRIIGAIYGLDPSVKAIIVIIGMVMLGFLPTLALADESTIFYEAPVAGSPGPGVIGNNTNPTDSSSVIIGGQLGNGQGNTSIGFASGVVNPGDWNTSVGNNAGGHGNGSFNSSLGYGAGGTSSGDSNVSVGENSGRLVNGDNNTAIGSWSGFLVSGDDNISIGSNANSGTTASNTVAIGNAAASYGEGGIAIGQAAGAGTTFNPDSIAIGNFSAASGTNAIAIGTQSVANGENSVALGAGSIANRDNTVSVGSPGAERQITSVADGVDDFDAVNVRQLNAVIATVGGGGVPGPSFADIDRLDRRIDDLDSKIDSIAKKAYAGVAIAMASAVPVVTHKGGRSAIVGLGHYGGQSAIAGGVSYMTQSEKLISVNIGAATSGDVGIKAGMSWAF